jgi:hypothetical protein
MTMGRTHDNQGQREGRRGYHEGRARKPQANRNDLEELKEYRGGYGAGFARKPVKDRERTN